MAREQWRRAGLESFLADPVESYILPIVADVAWRSEAARAQASRELAAALGERYTIENVIGVGGMATVYLAHDRSLGRAVAVKVLHGAIADSVGAERFVQEIQLTARLEHSRVVPVYERGDASGLLFFVMRYFASGSLRQHIEHHGPLSIAMALAVARDVAAALDHAHTHGVVHRDIKPANILLEGKTAFVADFGIAQLVDAAGANKLTDRGVVIGTPEYMSPEQAEPGSLPNRRSDVYSLGCVLYEMLGGEPPYTGPTRADVLAKHASAAIPDISILRSTVTPPMRRVVEKALQKSPADRFETCGDFINAFDAATREAPARPTMPRRSTMVAEAGWVIALAAVAFVLTTSTESKRPAALTQFEIALPESVSFWSGWGKKVAISRDGRRMLFIGERDAKRHIYVQELESPRPTLVGGTEAASYPEFSPDGRWILFTIATLPGQAKIYKVPIEGGTPALIVDSAGAPSSWTDDGRILYTRRGAQLHSITSEGRDDHVVARRARGGGGFGVVEPLPGSRYALVGFRGPARAGAIGGAPGIGLLNLADGSEIDLGLNGYQPRYVRDGYVVFVGSGGQLFAARFSLRRRAVADSPRMLAGISLGPEMHAKDFAVSDNGILLYRADGDYLPRRLVAVDTNGVESDLGASERLYDQPRVSPDGRYIAVTILCPHGGCGDVWMFDVRDRTVTPVTTDSLGKAPAWGGKGDRVEFVRDDKNGPAIVSRRLDGSGDSVVFRSAMTDSISVRQIAHDARGGSAVLRGARARPGSGSDLFIAPETNLHAMTPLVASRYNEIGARLAPGGRVVAYQSDESGQREVYLRPLTDGQRVAVSVAGGFNPVWSRDGKTIFYRTLDGWIAAASVSLTSGISVGSRRMLFRDVYERPPSQDAYDAFPDGRLVFIKPSLARDGITIVSEWRRLISTDQKP